MTADIAHKAIATLDEYFELTAYPPGTAVESAKPLFGLRFAVFCKECGFLPEADYPEEFESDKYDPKAAQFAARNAEGRVVGTSRLVMPSPETSFPFLTHCKTYEDYELPSFAECAEVSRLAVDRSYRRRAGDTLSGVNPAELEGARLPGRQGPDKRVNAPLLVLGLYREMYRYSRANGIRYWFAAMERSLAKVLSLYGFAFEAIGPEQDYYGPVRPYVGDLRSLERFLRGYNANLLTWFQGQS